MELTPQQTSTYNKAAFLCSRSEKCSYEIQEKLKQWGVSCEDSDLVIAKLKAENYLDDERFARAYAKDKFRFNHWGKQKIAFMLRSKNIPAEIIDLAFEEIEEQGYYAELLKLLTDKEVSIKAKDKYDKRNKLMRFAMGRGFETEQVYRVLKKMDI